MLYFLKRTDWLDLSFNVVRMMMANPGIFQLDMPDALSFEEGDDLLRENNSVNCVVEVIGFLKLYFRKNFSNKDHLNVKSKLDIECISCFLDLKVM